MNGLSAALVGLVVLVLVAVGMGASTGTFAGGRAPSAGVHLSEDGQEVIVSGRFVPGLEKRFRRVLDNASNAHVVRLFSPGGYVSIAGKIRNDIRERQLDTVVSGTCASACTFAFLAGEHRILAPGGKLGFHSFSLAGKENDLTDRELQLYYGYHGIDQAFVSRVSLIPATSVWYPRNDELLAARIVTEVRVPPRPWWKFWG